MLPEFVIIGAQKSASTYIHQCLKEHPEVYMPTEEIRHFEDPEYQQISLQDFEKQFDRIPREKKIGIKRPDYLAREECPLRLHRDLNEPKLIVTLRNPVERAISAFFWYLWLGLLPIESLEDGLNNIIHENYINLYPRSKDIIEYGFYYKHLTHYLNFFSSKNILILFDYDIRKNPLNSLKKIYHFLNIDSNYVPKCLNHTSNSGLYSIPRLKFFELRNKLLVGYRNNKIYFKTSYMHFFLINGVFKIIDYVLLSWIFGNTKPSLSDQHLEMLLSIYMEDINNLEELLDVNLKCWKTIETP